MGRCGTQSGEPQSLFSKFWSWTTQTRPHWRECKTEAAVLFCVFGVTGSSSVAIIRPVLKNTVGLEGSMKDGPWSYRIISLVLVSPFYATLLVFYGTVAGRHVYFASMARKILGRFLPRSLRSSVACPPAKAKGVGVAATGAAAATTAA